MATINLNPYKIKWDTQGITLNKHYIGKTKDGEDKEAVKLIGYYGKSSTSLSQALDAIIVEEISEQDQLSLVELKEFVTLQKEDVQCWVKEQMEVK